VGRQLVASGVRHPYATFRIERNQLEGGDPMISEISKTAMALLDHAGVGATSSEG
jgi:hypothetical protein